MRLYLETENLRALSDLDRWGAFSGVIVTQSEQPRDREAPSIAALLAAQGGDVLSPVEGSDVDELEARSRAFVQEHGPRLTVGLVVDPVGLEVMHRLRDERIWTAAMRLGDFGQALLAANAGADLLIPSYDAVASNERDPTVIPGDIAGLSRRSGGRPKVLVSGLKFPAQVVAVARLGVWGASLSPALAEALLGR